MKIIFTKDCGHHPKGEIIECENAPGEQYISGGFAELYVEKKPTVEPAQKPSKKKKISKKE